MKEWKRGDKCWCYGEAWEISAVWGATAFLVPWRREGEATTAALDMLLPLPAPPQEAPWRPEAGKPCLTEGGDGAIPIGPDPQLPNNHVCQVTFSDGSRDFESIHVSSLCSLPPAPPAQDLREAFAAQCHEQWSNWMVYLFSRATRGATGECIIPCGQVLHWKRQLQLPYDGLTEEEKESDRKLAEKFLVLIPRAEVADGE